MPAGWAQQLYMASPADMVKQPASQAVVPQIIVVQNSTEELKRLVPTP